MNLKAEENYKFFFFQALLSSFLLPSQLCKCTKSFLNLKYLVHLLSFFISDFKNKNCRIFYN